MRARASLGSGLVRWRRPTLLAAAMSFFIAVCHRKPFPLLPSHMTDEIIGDPPAPSGRPRARVMATPAGHDQMSWPPPRSPAGSGPADQACSFAASGQNLPSSQTASQEDDRKMTGSFTLPTRPGIKPAHRGGRPGCHSHPVAPPHHRLPCMTVMSAGRGRLDRPQAAEFPRPSEPEASSPAVPQRPSPTQLTPRAPSSTPNDRRRRLPQTAPPAGPA
jgi:hypothetical protein